MIAMVCGAVYFVNLIQHYLSLVKTGLCWNSVFPVFGPLLWTVIQIKYYAFTNKKAFLWMTPIFGIVGGCHIQNFALFILRCTYSFDQFFPRMAYFERVSAFLTQENLVAQITRHYTMQVNTQRNIFLSVYRCIYIFVCSFEKVLIFSVLFFKKGSQERGNPKRCLNVFVDLRRWRNEEEEGS